MNNKEATENIKRNFSNLKLSYLTPEELAEVREILDQKLAEIQFFQHQKHQKH